MSLASKSFAVLQREGILFVSSLLNGVVLARELGPHALGLWVILNLIPSYSEVLGRLKSDVAAVYYLGRKVHEIGDVIFALNMIAISTSLIIVLTILIFIEPFSAVLFSHDQDGMNSLIVIVLVQIPINFIYMNYTYLHIYREDVKSLNTMVMTRALGTTAFTVASLVVFHLGLAGVVVSYVAGFALATLVGVLRFGHVRRLGPIVNWPVLRDLLGYGGKMYVGNIVSHLNAYSSQAIVVGFCKPAEVAYFAVAQQFSQMITKVTDSMGVFLFPRIARGDQGTEARELAAKAFRIALVIMVPIDIFAALLIKPALLTFYGARYAPVLTPFYLLLPAVSFAAAANTLLMYLQGIGRADLVAKIAVAPLILQILLGFWLVSDLQIWGAAVSLAASLVATGVVQIVIFCRTSGASVSRDLRIRRADIKAVADFGRTTVARVLPFARPTNP